MNDVSRRVILAAAAGGAAALFSRMAAADQDLTAAVRNVAPTIDGRRIPPLFAVAYIDPGFQDQQGQEGIVAKYPIALVAQDMRPHFVAWRNRVRSLNPDILLLGYQIAIETTTVPGPGHDILRRTAEPTSFIRGFDGQEKTFGQKQYRLYDPRSKEWQRNFLDACSETLRSYPYRGLFIDECSVFSSHGFAPGPRQEMFAALAETLLELRKRHPNALLIGNSAYEWAGLNGEKNEQQEDALESELKSNPLHAKPELNCAVVKIADDNAEPPELRRKLIRVCRAGGLFAAAKTYQRVRWFKLYNEVVAAVQNQRDTP